MPTSTPAIAPTATPALSRLFVRQEDIGYNHVDIPRHPEKVFHFIDTMDLSKSVFLGQEHGVVTDKIQRKVLFVSLGTKETKRDTGKTIPNQQPYSAWTPESNRGMFKNHWENVDPFYGHGDGATVNFLQSAATNKLNLSKITEADFRADLKKRFLAHYTAQLERAKAYIPLIEELRQVQDEAGIKAFDESMKQKERASLLPERAGELYIPDWARPNHFQELAIHRIALLAECLPYNTQQLIDGMATFGVADTLSNVERQTLEFVDKNRYRHREGRPTPGILIARGETAKSAELMKELDSSVKFLEHGAQTDNRSEVRVGRLSMAGNYLAYIDILREGLDQQAPEIGTLNALETQVRAIIQTLGKVEEK